MRRSIVKLANLTIRNGNPQVSCVSSVFVRTVTSKKNEEDPHRYYKWGYKPLPVQTAEEANNPQFAVRPPEFKLPTTRGRLSRKEWRKRIANLQEVRQNAELEKLARNRQLYLPLDTINAQWRKEYGLHDLSKLANFYGITRDLFNNEDIVAKTFLDIAFNDVKIHRGNIIQPKQLAEAPTHVSFNSSENSLYSLTLTNLDGHPLDSAKEVIHWMICNLKSSQLADGETVFEYLPPLPWKGTGFHRVVFTLYKHDAPIRAETVRTNRPESLHGRSFSTAKFLQKSGCVPVSLAWCQMEWDESVSESYSMLRDLTQEPVFDWEEYIEPKLEHQKLRTELSELRYRNM